MNRKNFMMFLAASTIVLMYINLIFSVCVYKEIKSLREEFNAFEPVEYVVKVVEEKEEPEDVEEPIEETVVEGGIKVISEASVNEATLDPVSEETPQERLYSETEAIAMAKLLWGEARGVPDNGIVSAKCQQAAVLWTVLNRVDGGYSDEIMAVITAPNQFVGYNVNHPVDEELLELAYDVLDRWTREKNGETDVGRVLPAGYFWFSGDGRYNLFRNEYRSKDIWDWSLGDPYSDAA